MNAALSAALSAFVISLAATPLLRFLARRRGRLDIPGEASSHTVPTPRNGGFSIVAGIIVGSSVAAGGTAGSLIQILAAPLLVGAAAAIDEVKPLPRLLRLFIQIGLAILAILIIDAAPQRLLVTSGTTLSLGWLAIPAAVFWLVGSTNGYNFMDGLNGLSSSAAVICCGTLAILFVREGDVPAAAIAAAATGAATGFLPWNLPSGSIFMGDVGSATLGFLIGLLTLRLVRDGAPFLAASLPFLCFMSDAFLTLIRRAAAGERFFATRHRSHFYQLLNRQGWSHGAVTALWSCLMAVAAVIALRYDSLTLAGQVTAAIGVALLAALMFTWIALRQDRLNGRESQ